MSEKICYYRGDEMVVFGEGGGICVENCPFRSISLSRLKECTNNSDEACHPASVSQEALAPVAVRS